MASTSKNESADCPISHALTIFGDRWTLLVLRDLMFQGRSRYRDLLEECEGIATNVLSDRLKRLETHGLLTKDRDSDDARQFLYRPTERAIDLVPMLVEIIVWGARHGSIAIDQGFIDRFDTDRTEMIDTLQRQIRNRYQIGATAGQISDEPC